MKMEELRGTSPEELAALLSVKRGRLAELRFLVAQKKMKNVREIAAVKKDVARILTVLQTLNPMEHTL